MMQKFKEKNVNVTIHPTHPSKESLSRQPLLQFYKYFLKWYSTVCVLLQLFSLTINTHWATSYFLTAGVPHAYHNLFNCFSNYINLYSVSETETLCNPDRGF